MRRLRRALRRLAHVHPQTAPALGCVQPVAQPDASWARLEAERLLNDDLIAGSFMIGEPVDAPPPVLEAMDAIVRERERRHG